ncbi:type IV toxin-antitoxin system AbiEi family antitoxin domain-containing protein [Nocardia harenae]|uniref:type IV toxin-antitoxin system AbiEi family antitoxin domain-containing protein n=1 Tax=Nocardia harenae TaxID=358707 RepID=UPI000833FF1D|nr:type IV toxin-antitoxin system AbiEi family antitoxin domain-containing protein [Nocardia harenae]
MWEEQFGWLSAAAARQQGLITAAQAARLGVDGAAIARFGSVGLLEELDWTVYRLAGSSYGDRYAHPYAAWLALDPERFRWERPEAAERDAVLSHQSACAVIGLGAVAATGIRFVAATARPSPRTVTVTAAPVTPHEIVRYEGIPVTSAHRTILDLLAEWTPREEIAGVCGDAVRRDLLRLRPFYEDVLDIAEEYGLPTGGRHFVDYFLPGLRPETLSVRNLRDFAEIVYPAQVAEVRPAIERIIADVRPAPAGELAAELAAELVGRARHH